MAKKKRASKSVKRARTTSSPRTKTFFGIEKDFVIISGGGFLVIALLTMMFFH
jgi:hypothetical protein